MSNVNMLPATFRRQALEAAGVEFLEEVESGSRWWFVNLPSGWLITEKEEGESYLIDNIGRRRARIFDDFQDPVLKGPFMFLLPRYSTDIHFNEKETEVVGRVLDGGNIVVYSTPPFLLSEHLSPDEQIGLELDAGEAASDWVDEHFPDRWNREAYWNN